MSLALANFTDRLISISDLSKGKASKVFADIEKNNHDYIVLKNNQPTAVLISVQEYKITQEKVARLEKLLELIEDMRLIQLAKDVDISDTESFADFVSKEGYSMEEIEALAESVEIE